MSASLKIEGFIAGHQARDVEIDKLVEALSKSEKIMSNVKEDCRYVTWGEDETHFENTNDWEVLCATIKQASEALKPYQSPEKQ